MNIDLIAHIEDVLLLHVLRRVEFVQFSEGGEPTYWYLNLLKKIVNQVEAMEFNVHFEERTYSEI